MQEADFLTMKEGLCKLFKYSHSRLTVIRTAIAVEITKKNDSKQKMVGH